MRPIDADALKEAFKEDGHLSSYIEEFIDDAPTITVDEARIYSIWLYIGGGKRQCMNCGTIRTEFTRYCPICGAEMNGGKR